MVLFSSRMSSRVIYKYLQEGVSVGFPVCVLMILEGEETDKHQQHTHRFFGDPRM